VRAQIRDVEPQARQGAGQLVGEKDVAAARERVEDLAALVPLEVEPQRALAAVRVLVQHVHALREIHHAGAPESPHRVRRAPRARS
jgi:hypothetical protein